MRTERLIPKTAWFFSLLLGQASVLLGLMVALGWAFAFALLIPQHGAGWVAGTRASLPFEPPLIGLALGGLGLLLAPCGHQPVARYSVAGLILNTVPLVLALILLLIR
ncbi:hypothetical protein SAMN05444166_6362 [Singulisphaera sp. GP187]|uniref:hypothetical protein n=1 Tax=Singulisphaera sp. GP187 TaxID=1882752 RepID=UPI000929BCF5|nr:hypothetical protein [Singulisphaera sp. GP187]SIO60353.1 hypothetical protein SAMN05444166_6362 [Singulisphaera sp. GP187]